MIHFPEIDDTPPEVVTLREQLERLRRKRDAEATRKRFEEEARDLREKIKGYGEKPNA